jgi:hypothetical protein
MKISFRLHFLFASLLALSGSAASFAIDGAGAPPPSGGASQSYYESVVGTAALEDLEASGGGLPSALEVMDAAGSVTYTAVSSDPTRIVWELSVDVAERDHERVDAVYDLVVALPLPVTPQGRAGFRPLHFGIGAREGTRANSVAFVYGGEKIVLKRNVGLERTWLAGLVGSSGGLPDLSGSGYAYTLWDAVVRYDSGHGPKVQGHGTLQYTTEVDVTPPDPNDARFAAYVITWIPTLDPSIPPFTIRLDVQEAAE